MLTNCGTFGYQPPDYELKVELAKCCNKIANVYLALYKPTGEHVALKKYRMDATNKDESTMIRDEIINMRQFNHPNIHSFHTAFVCDSQIFVVSPLMSFGSCKDTIRNCFRTGFPETFVALIMYDVLRGLEYLHRRGFIHRSIRASHILLNQNKAVLAGFREGTSIVVHGKHIPALHQLAPFSTRSLNWLAPEVLEQNVIGYTEKSDIYSIGITCCEMANGIEPFGDSEPTFMFTEKIRGHVPTLLDRSTCPPSEELCELEVNTTNPDAAINARAQKIYCERVFSDEFHQFTEICLEKRPVNRWTASQLLSHSFFKQCRQLSISEESKRFGLEKADYSQLNDESLVNICDNLGAMQIEGFDWDWDF